MIKQLIIASAIASSLAACTAHAINADYHDQLAHSGCTQVSESRGCNVNMPREWNERHGFIEERHHSDRRRGDNARSSVSRREVNQFLQESIYDRPVADARQALYDFGCQRLGPDHWRKDDWEINLESHNGRVVSGGVHHF